MNSDVIEYWDSQAASFDEAPDHGLRDLRIRRAWANLLLPLVPQGARVADVGCGTGTLSLLLANAGHNVTGLDIAPAMIAAARRKATLLRVNAEFSVGDAAAPTLDLASYGARPGPRAMCM